MEYTTYSFEPHPRGLARFFTVLYSRLVVEPKEKEGFEVVDLRSRQLL